LEASHGVFGIKHGKVVTGFGGGGWAGSKPIAQLSRRVAGGGGPGWKVEREQVFVAGNGEHAGARLETDAWPAAAEMPKENMRRSKSRVAAQVDFEGRSKPAEMKQ
jgi:hypothetical protein